MTLFVLVVSLLHSILSAGVPVIPDSDLATADPNSTPVFLTNYRSTIQIVWTCFAIIFSSTWVCIHPHLPGHKASRFQRIGLRGRLFLNALLFPDQFVARAFREWNGSRSLYSDMEERLKKLNKEEPKWVEAQKLGEDTVRLVNDTKRLGKGDDTLLAASLREECHRLNTKWAHLKRLITKQLEDRGENPGEMQVEKEGNKPMFPPGEWTRVHANFIHMGGIVFKGRDGKAWYKDFTQWTDDDIKAFFDLGLTEEKLRDWSKADGLAKAFVIVQCLWFVLQCIGRTIFRLPLIELEVTCFAFIACNVGMHAFWWNKPLNVNCPEVIQTADEQPSLSNPLNPDQDAASGWMGWLKMLLKTLATGDFGVLIFPSRGRDDSLGVAPPSESPRFPVNYYYRAKVWNFETWDQTWDKHVEDLTQTVPLAVFGSLHAIAWFGTFPSVYEQLLWRASSVVPATLSLVLLLLFLVRRFFGAGVIKTLLHCAVYLILPINLAARYVFVVLPVLQLRSLPPLAHQTVPWADFLPHV